MLEGKSISKKFNSHPVLKGVNISIEKGKLNALIGPNASGKSTLLKVLSGIISPDEGNVFIDGKPINTLKKREKAKLVRFFPPVENPAGVITVKELILLSRFPHKGYFKPFTKNDEKAVEEAGVIAEVSNLLNKPYNILSSGEKSRVIIACSLAGGADYLLFDEASPFLDIKWEHFFFEKLLELTEKGKGILLVSHNLNAVINYTHYVWILKEGNIVGFGEVEKTLKEETIADVFGVECVVDARRKIVAVKKRI